MTTQTRIGMVTGLLGLLLLTGAPTARATEGDAAASPSDAQDVDKAESGKSEDVADGVGDEGSSVGSVRADSLSAQQVHVIQPRASAWAGRHELAVLANAKANVKHTLLAGAAAEYTYHPGEHVGLTVGGVYWGVRQPSGFIRDELGTKIQQVPSSSVMVLLRQAYHVSAEVTPVYGKFAWHGGKVGFFGLSLVGGAGVGESLLSLRDNEGATGWRGVGVLGASARVNWGSRWTLRLDFRDYVQAGAVETVNGCTYAALEDRAPECQPLTDGDRNEAKESVKFAPSPDKVGAAVHHATVGVGLSVSF